MHGDRYRDCLEKDPSDRTAEDVEVSGKTFAYWSKGLI